MKRIILGLAAVVLIMPSCGNGGGKAADDGKNEVIENIMARRSIRKYKTDAVEDEKLQQVITCGINAPNGMARESWEVRIVRQGELMDMTDSLYSVFMNKARNTENVVYKAAYGAPVLIFIASDERYDLSKIDCGLLGENIMLSAQSLGLGTCCLGGIVRFINSEEGLPVLERLEIPETHELLYAIAMGYPDEAPAAKPRTMSRVKIIE